jgi:hypothetical protein
MTASDPPPHPIRYPHHPIPTEGNAGGSPESAGGVVAGGAWFSRGRFHGGKHKINRGICLYPSSFEFSSGMTRPEKRVTVNS